MGMPLNQAPLAAGLRVPLTDARRRHTAPVSLPREKEAASVPDPVFDVSSA
jgi:hypothetical protein